MPKSAWSVSMGLVALAGLAGVVLLTAVLAPAAWEGVWFGRADDVRAAEMPERAWVRVSVEHGPDAGSFVEPVVAAEPGGAPLDGLRPLPERSVDADTKTPAPVERYWLEGPFVATSHGSSPVRAAYRVTGVDEVREGKRWIEVLKEPTSR